MEQFGLKEIYCANLHDIAWQHTVMPEYDQREYLRELGKQARNSSQ